jgi:hypothetical protein
VKYSLRFWTPVAALILLTIIPKLSLHPKDDALAAPDAATESLRRFLAPQSRAPLVSVRRKRHIPEWAGWRFSVAGCEALAFPSGAGGELDPAALMGVTAKDQVAFIYRGAVLSKPPRARLAVDYLTARLLKRPWPYYVMLIRPKDCAAPLAIPWNRL